MMGMIVAVVYTVCTNCVGVGSLEVTCDKCDGKGFYLGAAKRTVNHMNNGNLNRPIMPCKGCARGLLKVGDKGSGKVRKNCPTCKGRKKVKNND